MTFLMIKVMFAIGIMVLVFTLDCAIKKITEPHPWQLNSRSRKR